MPRFIPVEHEVTNDQIWATASKALDIRPGLGEEEEREQIVQLVNDRSSNTSNVKHAERKPSKHNNARRQANGNEHSARARASTGILETSTYFYHHPLEGPLIIAGESLEQRDLDTLEPGTDLNDSALEAGLKIIASQYNNTHIISPFFFTRCQTLGWNETKHFIPDDATRTLVIPIHTGANAANRALDDTHTRIRRLHNRTHISILRWPQQHTQIHTSQANNRKHGTHRKTETQAHG